MSRSSIILTFKAVCCGRPVWVGGLVLFLTLATGVRAFGDNQACLFPNAPMYNDACNDLDPEVCEEIDGVPQGEGSVCPSGVCCHIFGEGLIPLAEMECLEADNFLACAGVFTADEACDSEVSCRSGMIAFISNMFVIQYPAFNINESCCEALWGGEILGPPVVGACCLTAIPESFDIFSGNVIPGLPAECLDGMTELSCLYAADSQSGQFATFLGNGSACQTDTDSDGVDEACECTNQDEVNGCVLGCLEELGCIPDDECIEECVDSVCGEFCGDDEECLDECSAFLSSVVPEECEASCGDDEACLGYCDFLGDLSFCGLLCGQGGIGCSGMTLWCEAMSCSGVCNLPPSCTFGGSIEVECQGATTDVLLDGTGFSDPNGDQLTLQWTTDCLGGTFDDDTSETPTLTVDSVGPCPLDCTVTLTVTDDSGESAVCDADVKIVDTTAPVLSGVPGDVPVECDSVPGAASPTATDNCDTAPSIAYNEVQTDVICPNSYTLTRTWTATDSCGKSSSTQTQIITVVDTIPPVLAGCPADTTIECDAAIPDRAAVTATDNCDGNLTVSFSESTSAGSCPAESTITRTWTTTDACGNTASCSQIITVEDTTPPVISCNTPLSGTITPPESGEDEVDLEPIFFTVTAADADACCKDNVPVVEICDFDCFKYTKKGKRIDKTESCVVEVDGATITILNSGGVGTNITWTARAVDCCGNESICEDNECGVLVVKPAK